MQIIIDSYDSLTPEQANSVCCFVGTLVAPQVGTMVAPQVAPQVAPEPTPCDPDYATPNVVDYPAVTPEPVTPEPVTPEPVTPEPVAKAPTKRKRRTKAQITADKRQAAADKAILAAAKDTGVAEAASPAAPAPAAKGNETAPAAAPPAEAASVSPSEAAPQALTTGDMKAVVTKALDKLTAEGDPNPTKSVVAELERLTGKKRISEIEDEHYAVIAFNLKNLEYAPPATEVPDPLG